MVNDVISMSAFSVGDDVYYFPKGVLIPHQEMSDIAAMGPGAPREQRFKQFVDRLVKERDGRARMEQAEDKFVNKAPLQYNSICYQTYPCQHDVSLPLGKKDRWCGKTIAQWFLDNKYPLPPHFQCYVQIK